ncbi:MAG: hypothetical protein JWR26_3239 [Pedosphaera sp.]|nr:hypothetical protein [Pedosphaera sp.]
MRFRPVDWPHRGTLQTPLPRSRARPQGPLPGKKERSRNFVPFRAFSCLFVPIRAVACPFVPLARRNLSSLRSFWSPASTPSMVFIPVSLCSDTTMRSLRLNLPCWPPVTVCIGRVWCPLRKHLCAHTLEPFLRFAKPTSNRFMGCIMQEGVGHRLSNLPNYKLFFRPLCASHIL